MNFIIRNKSGVNKRNSNTRDLIGHNETLSSEKKIVIDFGSYNLKAGWNFHTTPLINVSCEVGRPKIKNQGDYVLVGHELLNASRARLNVRTPFDGELLSDVKSTEYCLDYIFSTLGVTGDRVGHEIWLNEPLGNPGSCRADMNELLFELYQVEGVGYSVDNLCSYYYNSHANKVNPEIGLSIHCGFHTCSVVPIIDSTPDIFNCAYLPLGGFHCLSSTIERLQLQYKPLRYPNLFSLQQAQKLCWEHAYAAQDYELELETIQKEKNPINIKLPPPIQTNQKDKEKNIDEIAIKKRGNDAIHKSNTIKIEASPGKKRKITLKLKRPAAKRQKINNKASAPPTPTRANYPPPSKSATFQQEFRDGYPFQFDVDRIRCVETLFQPTLVGEVYAGLGELIENVLKRFTLNQRKQMVQSVLISGGTSQFRGFNQRIHREIQTVSETNIPINIISSEQPTLSAYQGLCLLSDQGLPFLTRQDYFEYGPEYFKEHDWNNKYYTPAPPPEQYVPKNLKKQRNG